MKATINCKGSLCFWLAAAAMVGLTACGDSDEDPTSGVSSSSASSSSGTGGTGSTTTSSSGGGGAGGAAPTGPFVFASSTVLSGDSMPDASEACGTLAVAAGLPGTYTAWFSSNGDDAIDKIVGDGPWYRTDGALAFAERAALSTGPAVPIDHDESGTKLDPTPVFTGTSAEGTATGNDCLTWSSYYDKDDVTVGNNGATGASWTADSVIPCGTGRRFYCFQDTP